VLRGKAKFRIVAGRMSKTSKLTPAATSRPHLLWRPRREVEMTGPLAYHGQIWESGPGYDARWKQIGKKWVTQHTDGHVVSLTLETPWNTP